MVQMFLPDSVRENVCNDSKNVKTHAFLDFEKNKQRKNVRNYA